MAAMSKDLEDALWISHNVQAGYIISLEGDLISWQKCIYIADDCDVLPNILGYVN